jgi:hypothetical protein
LIRDPAGGPVGAGVVQAASFTLTKNCMSLFNWFSGKPAPVPSHGTVGAGDYAARLATPAASAARPATQPAERSSDDRKVRRHVRREQLYAAVRDTMTQSGVLSSSYRFKVLSLDQLGNQFLVMMDVDQAVDAESSNLTQIESRIVQGAKARFDIAVSSVYWRVTSQGLAPRPKPASPGPDQPARQPLPTEPVAVSRKPAASRYEPIQQDEIAAFKQALAAASERGDPARARSAPAAKGAARSYTLLTGFEDTEMPESYAAPVLSNTQYGDLN